MTRGSARFGDEGRRQGGRPSIKPSVTTEGPPGRARASWPAPGFTRLPPAAADPKGKCSGRVGSRDGRGRGLRLRTRSKAKDKAKA